MDPQNGGIPNLDDLQHALNNEMAQNSAAASTIPLQATTISTIIVQGGPLQLVIAILKSGDVLYIKVADLLPKITLLGLSLDEALNLQREHEELLQQVQNMPTPLEEFYHKVQEKIAANERPNPQLIEEMANTLNLVWMDVKLLLQERREIILSNVAFFERLGECYGKISAMEVACRDTMIPIEIDSVREFLDKFKLLRTEMLTAIIAALKVGNQLLDKLKALANVGSLDSRPNHIKQDAIKAVHQVEVWLEDLSNRRNSLDISWQSRKSQLEQCLTLAILAKELYEIEFMLTTSRNEVLSTFTLGDSENSANELLKTISGLKPDALMLRDKGLRITKATEELVSTGCFAGDEACAKAYNVLSNCTEYLEEIEQREMLLTQSKEFFKKATKLLIRLDQITVEISRHNLSPGSKNVIPLNMDVIKEVATSIEEILQFGYSLIDDVGRTKPEVMGVKNVVEEIERKKIAFEEICTKNSEQHIRMNEELNEFLERYNNIFTWLEIQKQERIGRGLEIHNMGQNLQEAKDCLLIHHQFLNDFEIKGNAINNLLTTLTPYFELLEDHQRNDIYQKVDVLRQKWIELKNFIITRVDLLKLYIKFFQECETLRNMYSAFDIQIKTFKNNDDLHLIESAFNNIQQKFSHLKNIGTQFIDHVHKVADSYLKADRAVKCVESILGEFGSRQLIITTEWENWTITRHIEIQLKEIMTANMETLSATSKIADQLYPIFTTEMSNPDDLVEFLSHKLEKILYEVKSSENELSSRIEKIEGLETTDQDTNEKVVQVKNNLNSIKTKLFTISADYSELIGMIDKFLKSIIECRGNIKGYFSKKQPVDEKSVDSIIEGYELFKENTMAHFRELLRQSEEIIEKIKAQEPPCAKEHDTDRVITLLEDLRAYFESETESENSELKKQHQIIEFDKDVKDLKDNIGGLEEQLVCRKGDYGENVDTATITVASFEYFERNVELLEKRIEHFVNTSKNIASQYPDTESYVDGKIQSLRNKWNELLHMIRDHKIKMELAVKYYHLIEVIESNYRNLNADLINANNKLPILSSPELAQDLIIQIDTIIKQYETQQLENLKILSKFSVDIYGNDKTVTLSNDNMKLFQTFYKIKSEIGDKAKELSDLQDKERKRLEEIERQRFEQERLRLEQERQSLQEQRRLVEEQEHQRVEMIKIVEIERKRFEEQEWSRLEIERQRLIEMQQSFENEKRLAEENERLRLIKIREEEQRLQNERRLAEENELLRLARLREEEARLEHERQMAHENELARFAKLHEEEERLRQARLLAEENDRARLVRIKAEEERIEKEKRQAEENEKLRLAKLKEEEERLKKERALAEENDRLRLARIKAEEERLEKEKRLAEENERIRMAKIKEEEERLLKERKLAEENDRMRLAKIKEEEERLKKDKKLAEENEKERMVKIREEEARLANERRLAEENERQMLAKLKDEEERLERDRKLAEENERLRLAKLKAEEERLENEKKMAAENDRIRLAKLKEEEERLEKERKLAEENDRIRLAKIKEEEERLENEKKLAKEKEHERSMKLKAEEERLAAEKKLAEENERFRLAKLKAEEERLENERKLAVGLEKARLAKLQEEEQRLENERKLAEENERLRLAKFKAEEERLENEKKIAEENERQRLEALRIEEERIQKKLAEEQMLADENARKVAELEEEIVRKKAKLIPLEMQRTITSKIIDEIDHQFQHQDSIEIEPIDELKYVEELQQPLFIQTEEEIKYENVHEVISELENEPPMFIEALYDIITQEGDKIELQCTVNGFPEPTIEWFKDGISILNNPDYKTTYDHGSGVCALTIEETFAEDSATFTCQAKNAAGQAETSAMLTVNEAHPQEQMAPPVFVKKLESGHATEGSTFEFRCAVDGHPLPVVQWFKYDKCIDNSPDYNISYNNGEAVLRFDEVFLEDEADYMIRASNDVGVAEMKAIFSVEPLEPTEMPLFKTPLSNVMARVGQKIRLDCEVTGIPTPQVSWTHDGKPFTNREVKFSYENGRATLIISEAFLKDAGTYTVTAKNIAGEKTSSSNVVVKGKLPNETSDSEIASDMEPIKPSIQLELKDVSVFEGKTVQLDCVIVGQPEPEVIWYHNERPVKESADVQLLFQGDRCSLFIQEAFLEDAGHYKVVAINSAGEASSLCNLTVTPLNETEPAVRTPVERLLPNGEPPKFGKLLSDILAAEGETIEFIVSITGEPRPSVKWFLNNKEIEESVRIKSEFNEDGAAKLTVNNVSPEDKGVYTVKASNPSGESKCFSHLIVKSINAAEPPPVQVELEEKFICPTFKELFSDRACTESDTIKFECIVVGKPTPKVKWFFNDEPVAGSNFLVSTSGDRQVLTIPKVTKETAGKVSCIAENDVGKATCVAFVKVTPDGTLPTFKETMIQEDSSGSSFITMKKQTITTTSSHTSSTLENGIPHTQMHTTSSLLDSSFKKVGDEPAEVSESKQFSEFKQMGDLPPSITQEKIINITKSSAESIIANSGQISTGKPARRHVSPRYVSPLIGKIVDQGSDVVIEGIVDGFPVPEMKVLKNDIELLEEGDRVKVRYNLNKVTIMLKDVGIKDAGRYSAIASNPAGSATSTADLVVKKSIFPPVFGRRLQAQVVKRGDRVIMDVEVTGTPDPTVTWMKDDKPIKEALTGSFRIQQIGICHKLILDSAKLDDAGRYMVRASNAGGEAQSIADFAVYEPEPQPMESVKRVVFEDMIKQNEQDQTSGFSAHQESSSESKIQGGSTESTVITETRRTTEQTMRMEHKISFPDFTFSHKPKITDQSTMAESEVQNTAMNTDAVPTKMVQTQTSLIEPEKPVNENVETVSVDKKSVIKFFEQRSVEGPQTPTQIVPKPIRLVADDENENMSAALSRQNAFQFFEKKIQIVPEEKYTKFEDLPKVPEPSTIPKEFLEKLEEPISHEVVKVVPKEELDQLIPQKSVLKKISVFERANDDSPKKETFNIGRLNFLEAGSPEPQQIFFKQPFLPMPVKTVQFKELPKAEHKGNEEYKEESAKPKDAIKEEIRKVEESKLEIRQMTNGFANDKEVEIEIKPVQVKTKEVEIEIKPVEVKTEEMVQPDSTKPVEFRHETHSEFKTYHHVETNQETLNEPLKPASFAPLDKSVFEPPKPKEFVPLSFEEAKVEHVYKPVEFHPIPQNIEKGFTTFSSSKKAFFESKHESNTINKHTDHLKPSEETVPTPPIFQTPDAELEILQPKPTDKPEYTPNEVPSISTEDHIGYRPQAPYHHLARTPSPRPSSEAVEMERIWAHPKQDAFFYSSESHAYSHHEELQKTPEPTVEEQVRTQSIKETKQIFEEKIRQMEQSELKAPGLIRQISQAKPVQPEVIQIAGLEPGEPPEICFAPKQVIEKKIVKMEKIDSSLYETFDKEPSKILPGAVKIIPPAIGKGTPPLSVIKPKPVQPVPIQTPIHKAQEPIIVDQLNVGVLSTKEEEYKSNMFITTKQYQHHELPLEPMPFKPDAPQPKAARTAPPPSPSKFVKGTFTESDNLKAIDGKIVPIWSPNHLEPDIKGYKPVRFTPSGRKSATDTTYAPPPSVFDNPPQISGPPRPKFEPIDKVKPTEPAKVAEPPKIEKPKAARPTGPFVHQQQTQQFSSYQQSYQKSIQQHTQAYEQSIQQQKQVIIQPRPVPIQQPKPIQTVQQPIQHPKPVQPVQQPIQPVKSVPIQQPIKPLPKQVIVQPKPIPAQQAQSFVKHAPGKQTVIQQTAPKTTLFYTGVAGSPVATETSKTMHMKESSESYNRVVNMTQTRRVINLDEKLEPFPFKASEGQSYPRPKVPPPPTPTKFIPGQFSESGYDGNDVRIRPVWTPNPMESDDPRYRPVRPHLQGRSTSVPRSYERVMTPMEFDVGPVQMPSKIDFVSPSPTPVNFTSTLYRDQVPMQTQTLNRYSTSSTTKKVSTTQKTQDDIDIKSRPTPINYIAKATGQMDHMNAAFKSKAQQFVSEIITEAKKQPQKPILKKSVSVNESGASNAQAYREESRVSQYGTKHVDPDTGIIYFKYDFGYEFGIIFPGEGRKIVAGSRADSKNPRYINSRAGDIEVPVIHEKTIQDEKAKKRLSLPNDYWNGYVPKACEVPEYSSTQSYSRTTTSSSTAAPSVVNQQETGPAKRPPLFITPLKDIAVVSGQPARFECIVQSDSPPKIYWTKNRVPIQNSQKYNIEYRNGVCRLVIPKTSPADGGQFCCIAENHLGNTSTFSELIVPANNWAVRK